ncbi:glycosyltransferase family 39 protein [Bacillus sp. NP157]|nr:glycosyltransferase family 39 protein [Bacillus sp. NP157]
MKKRWFAREWLYDRPWALAFLWLVPAALLPVVPIDETRYLSIAWEMRQSGDAIGLTLNGHPYMDKSPLLFWLVNVAWAVFGVSTLAARLVCIGFAAGAVATVTSLARRLGLEDPASAGWMLLPFVVFGAFTPIAMFDVPLVFFVVLALLGLVVCMQGRLADGAAILLVASTLGMLAKGPVYLVHLIGPLAAMRWWHGHALDRPWRLAAVIAACLLAACAPLAAWGVINAMRIHGVPVLQSLTHQSLGRVSQSFAHDRSTLWYVPWILPFLLPWTFLLRWTRLRRGLLHLPASPAGRLAIASTLPAFIAFSLISGKQIHYLLPLLPGAALGFAALSTRDREAFAFGRGRWLLVAAALAWTWPVANAVVGMRGNPTWYVAAVVAAALLSLGAIGTRRMASWDAGSRLRGASFAALAAVMASVLLMGMHVKAHMDPGELADAVLQRRSEGMLVAAVDDEPAMVTYLARLSTPLPRITDTAAWAREHPGGLALVHSGRGEPPSYVDTPILLADGWAGLVPASRLAQVHP